MFFTVKDFVVIPMGTSNISNYTHHKVWDEIANPFLNSNGATVEV